METVDAALTEYELERGKPMPSKNHAIVQTNLIIALAQRAEKYRILSELSLDLASRPMTPDISVYPRLEVDWVHDEVKMTEPPLLVVEILSPLQAMQDLVQKIEIYFEAGVKSCWLVQPMLQSIVVFAPGMERTIYTDGDVTDPATAITVALNEIFR